MEENFQLCSILFNNIKETITTNSPPPSPDSSDNTPTLPQRFRLDFFKHLGKLASDNHVFLGCERNKQFQILHNAIGRFVVHTTGMVGSATARKMSLPFLCGGNSLEAKFLRVHTGDRGMAPQSRWPGTGETRNPPAITFHQLVPRIRPPGVPASVVSATDFPSPSRSGRDDAFLPPPAAEQQGTTLIYHAEKRSFLATRVSSHTIRSHSPRMSRTKRDVFHIPMGVATTKSVPDSEFSSSSLNFFLQNHSYFPLELVLKVRILLQFQNFATKETFKTSSHMPLSLSSLSILFLLPQKFIQTPAPPPKVLQGSILAIPATFAPISSAKITATRFNPTVRRITCRGTTI